MSRSLTLGQYLPGNSPVHLLSPRTKIALLTVLLILLFSLKQYCSLVILLALAFVLLMVAGIPLRYFFKGLKPVLIIIFMALFVYLFFTKGGVVLWRLGPVTIESAGLYQGVFVITRLFVLIIFSLLVTLTTTPLALSAGMGYFLKPLDRLGLPTEEITLIMSVALRFIPTLMEESARLMRAQISRGADFVTGSLFKRAKNLAPLIVPLFVGAFRRADDLALAMEARGYRIGAKRSRLHEDKIGLADLLSLAFAAALLVTALLSGL